MRVLIINKFLYPNGGSETYIFKLGEALEQHGHEVQYFGMEHEGRCVGNQVNAYTSDMDFHGGSKLSKLTYPIKTIYSKEAREKLRLVLDDFKVRAKVRCCDRDCWMIGSVSPAMHKYIWKPATWVLVHKFKALFTKHPYSMYELKICRDYRDGKVTKEDLDKCSTCDMNCVINNGLSEASKEQLKHKTGEEIVDADIAQQMETKTSTR